jgi:hypothetical protein
MASVFFEAINDKLARRLTKINIYLSQLRVIGGR